VEHERRQQCDLDGAAQDASSSRRSSAIPAQPGVTMMNVHRTRSTGSASGSMRMLVDPASPMGPVVAMGVPPVRQVNGVARGVRD
jgi:hypothetical protein